MHSSQPSDEKKMQVRQRCVTSGKRHKGAQDKAKEQVLMQVQKQRQRKQVRGGHSCAHTRAATRCEAWCSHRASDGA